MGLSQDDPSSLELLTQIARAQGFQGKFDEAHNTLGIVEKKLNHDASRAKVRYLLERGRAFNSFGSTDQARPLFEQAEEMATQLLEDFYADVRRSMAGRMRTSQAGTAQRIRENGITV